jgi:hypothetical protein
MRGKNDLVAKAQRATDKANQAVAETGTPDAAAERAANKAGDDLARFRASRNRRGTGS